jgi:hypothetical protein
MAGFALLSLFESELDFAASWTRRLRENYAIMRMASGMGWRLWSLLFFFFCYRQDRL